MSENERKIVIPGEIVVTGEDYLPGDGAYRDGENIVARKFGLSEISDRMVKVLALSGAYTPRRGNTIITFVTDITSRGWLLDFGGSQNAFLPVSEVPKYVNKNELREHFDFGEAMVCKVWDVSPRGIDVSIKMRGFGKIEGGMLMEINPNRVPRVIGKEGSMVKMIKEATDAEIVVGQNGRVWIKADSIENELNARKIIEFICENVTLKGLTEKVEEFIKEMGGKK